MNITTGNTVKDCVVDNKTLKPMNHEWVYMRTEREGDSRTSRYFNFVNRFYCKNCRQIARDRDE